MNIYILTYSFIDKTYNVLVGGLENYVYNLAKSLSDSKHKVYVVAPGENIKNIDIDNFSVLTFPEKNKNYESIFKKGIKIINSVANFENDILIFASEELAFKNKFKKSILIQHGIYWDRPISHSNKFFTRFFIRIKEALRVEQKLKVLSNVKKAVFVDSNFPCWLRSSLKYIPCDYKIIYNFADDCQISKEKDNSIFSVVFARRFVEYRGTRVMAKAIKIIQKLVTNDEFNRMEFTFAGNGPDEEYLKKEFLNYNNITITEYSPGSGVQFQSSFNVAVIPTTGSEGTSLSAIEAMSAKCAVIATNVGGLNDIIINNYNGIIVNPDDPNAIAQAILHLFYNPNYALWLSKNGRLVFESCFTKREWCNKWISFIEEW